MNPSIRVCHDHESLSHQAVELILSAVAEKADLLLCAAGGSTPLRTYQLLAQHRARTPQRFDSMRVVKLDEWGGLAMDDPCTCEHQLRTLLVNPLGISEDRYLGFNSCATEPKAECEKMRTRLLTEGPIDYCVLGLGLNGHIAMNEPAESLKPAAHVARLTAATLAHPMLDKCHSKPTFGLTLGMDEILASREILLLVSGASKREPLQKLLQREISTHFPASFLWLHPNWIVLCDSEAVASLNLEL